MSSVDDEHAMSLLLAVDVAGRPATYGTGSASKLWREAVKTAIAGTGSGPWSDIRFMVRILFRTPPPRTANDVWDTDNLVKETLDGMAGVFGERPGAYDPPQAADHLAVVVVAGQRTVRDGEQPGARIKVHRLDEHCDVDELVFGGNARTTL